MAIASYHIVDGRPTYPEIEKILLSTGFPKVRTEHDGETITYSD